ncbi:collagen-like protein [Aurantibacter crassamenti]|uniref:collagen-like triple helix repeat-containing protein n=1 Tax=Aurantibacter crassamenti TaxID=1837375 RepID=UPI00193AD409|nr:collagen-like protein [Aurantibacter crassamenti]MBM1107874.1 collagen-like protein [Aurantibacter crassamenti]
MKKATLLFTSLITLLFISCTGPEGPPGFDGFDGPQGPPGQDGLDAEIGNVFDVVGDFTAENDYQILVDFNESAPTLEVFENDVVLIYILWDQTVDNNGENVDIWRLMPQTLILNQGLLQYNYDHTFLDANIFLEADFDLSTLPSADTDEQIFRIAVLPANLVAGSKLDKSNIANVLQTLGVEENNIPRIKVN